MVWPWQDRVVCTQVETLPERSSLEAGAVENDVAAASGGDVPTDAGGPEAELSRDSEGREGLPRRASKTRTRGDCEEGKVFVS